MKILLLEVGEPRTTLAWDAWFRADGRFGMPDAGMVAIASLCRPHDEVSIHDEKVEGPFPVEDVQADLVGLTYKSMFANRAHRIADRLRARGIKVVLGGVHASAQSEEASKHADVVVVGEGEGVWPIVLEDIERGDHKPIYRAGKNPTPLDTQPPQRGDLLRHDGYMVHSLQSARGCSFSCEFCPTRALFGDKYRLRALDAVVGDVQRFVAREDKPIFFTENVFGAGHLPFVEAVTSSVQRLGIKYAAICDWQITTPMMIRILAKNGLGLVGINMTGRQEPEEEEALKAFHAAGIPIWGYIMFGFEEDTPDVFQGAIDKIRRYDIVCVSPTVLAPYPGTPMAARLAKENRIFNHDTDLLDQHHVVFHPKNMTATDLEQGYQYVRSEISHLLRFEHAIDAIMPPRPREVGAHHVRPRRRPLRTV